MAAENARAAGNVSAIAGHQLPVSAPLSSPTVRLSRATSLAWLQCPSCLKTDPHTPWGLFTRTS
ncbi:MAG: hypothetical protein GY864_09100 [Desulfobacterales bacterium]|nr:hypothetical protein [Desulfobacterales bacterium]